METESMRTLVLAKGEGGTEWNQEESGCDYTGNTGKIFVVMEMFFIFINEISWFYLQDITNSQDKTVYFSVPDAILSYKWFISNNQIPDYLNCKNNSKMIL